MNYNELFIEISKLPKPLSKDEITKLFIDFKNGNMDARNKIIEHNIRLVVYEVNKKYYNIDYDKEELVSIGIMGLMKAVDNYDINNGANFTTYSTRCIDNEILLAFRKIKKNMDVDSLNKVVAKDNNLNEQTLEDIIPSYIDITENIELDDTNQTIRKIVNELPDKHKEIISLRYGFKNGKIYTQNEVADMLCISQSYISRLEKSILKQIGIKLKEIDVIESSDIDKSKIINGNNKVKNVKSIYEYFDCYSKEHIDEIILNLEDYEKELLYKRYGNDLSNPIKTKLSIKESNSFYSNLIPRINRMLKRTYNDINNIVKYCDIDTFLESITISSKTNISINDFNEYERESIIDLLNSNYFMNLIKKMNKTESLVILLRFGFVDGKEFSIEEISKTLNINTKKVRDIIISTLTNYKKKVLKSIDDYSNIIDINKVKKL